MSNKGTEFKGLAAGANYKRWAVLFGFTKKFYRKGVSNANYNKVIKALDLGCGPGALSYALAEKVNNNSHIIGVDISNDQIDYANKYTEGYPCKLEFIKNSMDQLEFPDNHFDLVMTSMALHETPPEVRRKTIKETQRVLKNGGEFILIDWSKPKFGLFAIIWLPLIYFQRKSYNKDNWYNQYKQICENEGLKLVYDKYINSIVRKQVFKKTENK